MSENASRMPCDATSLYANFLADLTGDVARHYEFESDWRSWLTTMLPGYLSDKSGRLIPFGEHHAELWDWAWTLRPDVAPPPLVAIWPRGGGKSTTAELVAAMVGALRTRKYVLYVCETQERAEDHVSNVAGMFELSEIERYYPHVGNRLLSKYGSAKGWRRNRLRTASGFTVDAIGLDAAGRGVKLDDVRPDLIIFDDLDGEHDTPAATAKKIKTITTKFLPARSRDGAVLMLQNLIIATGIFSQLAGLTEEPADFLHERVVSGPFPAVQDLEYEAREEGGYRITGGTPIWAGMNLAECEVQINVFGLTSFLSESQQEVGDVRGGMFGHLDFKHCEPDEVPSLERIECWIDPAVTDTDSSDSHGIQIDGLARNGTVYRLWSWEKRCTPETTVRTALLTAIEYGCSKVGFEVNQGGDLWATQYRTLVKDLRASGELPPTAVVPKFDTVRASRSTGDKIARAQQMLFDYERPGRIVHVRGTHTVLEKALRRFPKVKPFDLTDASYYAWHSVSGRGTPSGGRAAAGPPRAAVSAYQPR